MMSAALEAIGLTLAYGPKATALDNVGLCVEAGQCIALLGPNGAGKSSLLRVLAGLVRPRSGEVRCGAATTPAALRGAVSFCPDQGGLYALPAPVVGQHLAAAWPGWDSARFAALMEALAIPVDRLGTTLSRGEAARLRLAMALCRPARVLLLDEPLGGVDAQSREVIGRLLATEVLGGSLAVIIATHEVRDVEALVDRVLVLDGGRVARDEEADTLRIRCGRSIDEWLRGGMTG